MIVVAEHHIGLHRPLKATMALSSPLPPSGRGATSSFRARPAQAQRFSHSSLDPLHAYHVEHLAAAVEFWRMALRYRLVDHGQRGGS